MYILLTLTECVVIIPQCWGGLFLSMEEDPVIVDALPVGVEANKPVNHRKADLGQDSLTYSNRDGSQIVENYVPQKYEYYYDGGSASKEQLIKAINIFKAAYLNNLENQLTKGEVNPAVFQLDIALNEVRHSSSSLNPRMFHNVEKPTDGLIRGNEQPMYT